MCIWIISLIKVIIKKCVRNRSLVVCWQFIGAPNFYCCNFNGRAVPWVSPFEFSVCKCRKVEFSAWLTERKTRAVSSDFIFSLVSKAESSDKKLNRYFHEATGLKEPGFENRRTFSKKAREPQKLLRFQLFSLVNVSESPTVKEALKAAWRSSTLMKAIFKRMNVWKIEQSFHISRPFEY